MASRRRATPAPAKRGPGAPKKIADAQYRTLRLPAALIQRVVALQRARGLPYEADAYRLALEAGLDALARGGRRRSPASDTKRPPPAARANGGRPL